MHSRDPEIGYNIAKGGEGGVGGPMFAGHRHSKETRKQMSESRKGEKNSNFGNHRKMPEEEKIKHANFGKTNGMFGKKHSDETKLKNREKHIGKKAYSNPELDQVKMLSPEEGEKLLATDTGWIQGNIHRK